MKPTYMIVKYDLFPGWLVHKVDRIEEGKCYLTDNAFFKPRSILGLIGEKKAGQLRDAIDGLKKMIVEAKASAQESANDFLKTALEE